MSADDRIDLFHGLADRIERDPKARERFEREYILRTWAAQQGNMSRTAEVLGVERSNLYRKMRAFGIAPARRPDEDAL